MATEDFSWLAFFLEAGIPGMLFLSRIVILSHVYSVEMHAQSYAEVFEDNRIQHTMMEELNKEVLQVSGVVMICTIFLYWLMS